jgi:hypothetical protein
VGTDGQALTANSGQATGLQWNTIQPNAVANSGNIARYNGTSGNPVPLRDSGLLITDVGAIQSTPTGGNARGNYAVDLQVLRVANTQVASGASSGILAGHNNTASGSDSAVAGGLGNSATQGQAGVCCGTLNTASGPQSFVGGGNSNTANGVASSVLAGASNTASGQSASVGGGSTNTAGATNSCVVGGANNTANGASSAVLGGSNNSASGSYSSTLGGLFGSAYLYGQTSTASGQFASVGDAQASILVARNLTTDNTPTELFLDGFSARLVLPTNTVWGFAGQIVGRTSTGNNEIWPISGGIKNNGGVVSLVGAVTIGVSFADAGFPGPATVGITADAVNLSLKITVTGVNGSTIRWVAFVRLVEIRF